MCRRLPATSGAKHAPRGADAAPPRLVRSKSLCRRVPEGVATPERPLEAEAAAQAGGEGGGGLCAAAAPIAPPACAEPRSADVSAVARAGVPGIERGSARVGVFP